jgi:hypothetical protein
VDERSRLPILLDQVRCDQRVNSAEVHAASVVLKQRQRPAQLTLGGRKIPRFR